MPVNVDHDGVAMHRLTTLPGSVSISHWKNLLALGYIAVSAAPALYLPPVILVAMVGLAMLQCIYLESTHAAAPYVGPLLLLLGYAVASAMGSGVGLLQLFSYDAIRYDANIFYSTLPLILLGSGEMTLARLDKWIGNTAIVGTLAYIVCPLAGLDLFESHNAAGGFYMILLAYLVGRAVVDGLRDRFVPLLATMVALLLSDSRGSVVAVAVAVVLRLSRTRHPRVTLVAVAVIVGALLAGLAVCHQIWVDNGSIFLYDYSDFGSVADGLSFDEIALGERPGTILHRLFFLYPMAIDLFLQSPIFGVGFTRFDDFPVQIQGVAGVLAFNHGPVQHTNLHAHNSYLHIAAETGIVGLCLLYRFLSGMFRTFKAHADLFAIVEVVLSSLMLASMTEHRLTTPSQAAPAFIIVALLWATVRARRLEAWASPATAAGPTNNITPAPCS